MSVLKNRGAGSEPNRDAIVRETARLLASRGYNGTSLRDIADAVGIQQASLYNHYESKQHLVADVMASSMREMIASVATPAADGDTPKEALVRAVRAHVEFQGERSDQALVCREELRSLGAEEATAIVELRAEYEQIFVSLVEAGDAAGELASSEPRMEVKALIEMWSSVAAWYRPDGRMSLSEIGQSYAELALAALGAAEKPAGGDPAASAESRDPATPADQIRAAATRLFAERGYHGASLRDLAEEAQVPSSTIYHYFSNKEEVLFSIMETAMVELLGAVREAYLGAGDPAGQLAAVVVAHVRFHASHREAALVSDAELRSLSGHPRQAIVSMRLEYEALFRSILGAGVTTGVFRIADVDATVFGLIRMCSGIASWYDPAGSVDLDRIAEDYADLSLRMTRAHG